MNDEIKKLRELLVTAVIPLEVLYLSSKTLPYKELSPELLGAVEKAVLAAREYVKQIPEPTEPEKPRTMWDHVNQEAVTWISPDFRFKLGRTFEYQSKAGGGTWSDAALQQLAVEKARADKAEEKLLKVKELLRCLDTFLVALGEEGEFAQRGDHSPTGILQRRILRAVSDMRGIVENS